MKKKVLSIIFIVLICTCLYITSFAASKMPRLIDDADLLTDSVESDLLTKLDSVSEKYKVDIVIATVETVGDYTPDEYINHFYDANDYGYGKNRDGVLLLVSMEERDYRILSNGLGADAISSDDIEDIGEKISSYLGDGNYEDAFNNFIEECEYQINGEINGFPFDFAKNLIISLAVGFVIAFIATGVMKGQLKSVKKQVAATEYTKKGSMQVNLSNDFFLYSTVNRRKKQQNNSSSSSGSSRNVGGGKF